MRQIIEENLVLILEKYSNELEREESTRADVMLAAEEAANALTALSKLAETAEEKEWLDDWLSFYRNMIVEDKFDQDLPAEIRQKKYEAERQKTRSEKARMAADPTYLPSKVH